MPWKQPTVVSSRVWIRCNYHNTLERSIVVKTAVGKEMYVAFSGMSTEQGMVIARAQLGATMKCSRGSTQDGS